jgi:uncharacterized protein YdcH (DUF465 family)
MSPIDPRASVYSPSPTTSPAPPAINTRANSTKPGGFLELTNPATPPKHKRSANDLLRLFHIDMPLSGTKNETPANSPKSPSSSRQWLSNRNRSRSDLTLSSPLSPLPEDAMPSAELNVALDKRSLECKTKLSSEYFRLGAILPSNKRTSITFLDKVSEENKKAAEGICRSLDGPGGIHRSISTMKTIKQQGTSSHTRNASSTSLKSMAESFKSLVRTSSSISEHSESDIQELDKQLQPDIIKDRFEEAISRILGIRDNNIAMAAAKLLLAETEEEGDILGQPLHQYLQKNLTDTSTKNALEKLLSLVQDQNTKISEFPERLSELKGEDQDKLVDFCCTIADEHNNLKKSVEASTESCTELMDHVEHTLLPASEKVVLEEALKVLREVSQHGGKPVKNPVYEFISTTTPQATRLFEDLVEKTASLKQKNTEILKESQKLNDDDYHKVSELCWLLRTHNEQAGSMIKEFNENPYGTFTQYEQKAKELASAQEAEATEAVKEILKKHAPVGPAFDFMKRQVSENSEATMMIGEAKSKFEVVQIRPDIKAKLAEIEGSLKTVTHSVAKTFLQNMQQYYSDALNEIDAHFTTPLHGAPENSGKDLPLEVIKSRIDRTLYKLEPRIAEYARQAIGNNAHNEEVLQAIKKYAPAAAKEIDKDKELNQLFAKYGLNSSQGDLQKGLITQYKKDYELYEKPPIFNKKPVDSFADLHEILRGRIITLTRRNASAVGVDHVNQSEVNAYNLLESAQTAAFASVAKTKAPDDNKDKAFANNFETEYKNLIRNFEADCTRQPKEIQRFLRGFYQSQLTNIKNSLSLRNVQKTTS